MSISVESIIATKLPTLVRASVLAAWRETPADDRWHIVSAAQQGDVRQACYLLGRFHQEAEVRRALVEQARRTLAEARHERQA